MVRTWPYSNSRSFWFSSIPIPPAPTSPSSDAARMLLSSRSTQLIFCGRLQLPGTGDSESPVPAAVDSMRYRWRAFSASAATIADAEILEIPVGRPLLVRKGVNAEPGGAAALYVCRRLRGDRMRFRVDYPNGGG